MSDCLSSTDKIKINFAIECNHGKSMSSIDFSQKYIKKYVRYMLQNNLKNVQLVNLNLSKGILSLKENNERLEGRVRRIVSETVCTFKRLKGRKIYE